MISRQAAVRSHFEITLRTPAEALRILHGEGAVLPAHEQVVLGRKAVNALATRLTGVQDPVAGLNEVRAARAHAGRLEPESVEVLQALQARLEQRVVAESVGAVAGLAEKGDWGRAGQRAGGQLQRPETTPEVKQALADVIGVSQQAEALDRLDAALQTVGRGRPAQNAFRSVPLERLPAPVREPVRGLRGIAEVRLAAERGAPPPDVARVKQAVADLRAGTGNAELAGRVQQDLAVKALLDGHPAEARQLLPADGPPEHAARLLRDMKALALGQGEVSTTPAREAVAGKPGPRDPPPGLKPLVPEGKVEGPRPGVRESALADLPPVEEAGRLEQPLKQQAEANSQAERKSLQQRARATAQHLQGLHQRYQKDEDEQKKMIEDLEKRLGRKMIDAEQVRAWSLRRAGARAEQIAAGLGKLNGGAAPAAAPPVAAGNDAPDRWVAAMRRVRQRHLAKDVARAVGAAAGTRARPELVGAAEIASALAEVLRGARKP
jgi:hypothetical protein